MTPEQLQHRVDAVCAWARARIELCRRQELKFGAPKGRRTYATGDVLVEAYTERHALEAVVKMLEGEAGDEN